MKQLRNAKDLAELREANEMGKYILTLISGSADPTRDFFQWIEKGRIPIILSNYGSWGATDHKLIFSIDGCVGLQFKVSGLLFQGLVRVWYNYGTDYFEVELIKNGSCIKEIVDIDFENLHRIIHEKIEEK